MKETIKYGITLALICLVSTGLLSFVYSLTEHKILNQKKAEENQSIKEVLSEIDYLEEKRLDDLVYYVGYDKNRKEKGKAVIIEAKGYSGNIAICVGIDTKGKILAIKILSHTETPGLGSKVAEPEFLDKFKNRKITDIGSSIAITGATISSTAVINSVKERAEELLKKISHN